MIKRRTMYKTPKRDKEFFMGMTPEEAKQFRADKIKELHAVNERMQKFSQPRPNLMEEKLVERMRSEEIINENQKYNKEEQSDLFLNGM